MNDGIPVCLNITYRCNARCKWCHCGCDIIDGSDTDMTLDQIEQFCESVGSQPIKSFRIAGGEPTLLPILEEACAMIASRLKFKLSHLAPHVSTNGLLARPPLPKGWRYRVDQAAFKAHSPVWWSPDDLGIDALDYVCTMPRFCGITYDHKGWTFCQIAAQLGKVLNIDVHSKSWRTPRNLQVCKHCVYSVPEDVRESVYRAIQRRTVECPTKTWKAALNTVPKRS